MRTNVPVLMWYPYSSSPFGLGGGGTTPTCQCGAEMNWVALIPSHDAVWGIFYCFACAPTHASAPVKARMGKGQGLFVWHLEHAKHQEVVKKLGPSFVGMRAVAKGMSDTPDPYQARVGEGVYSHGISPIPAPTCSTCQKELEVVLHVDSVAHEDLQWGMMDNFVVWACPFHPTSVQAQVVPSSP